jgi:hypothetical protein
VFRLFELVLSSLAAGAERRSPILTLRFLAIFSAAFLSSVELQEALYGVNDNFNTLYGMRISLLALEGLFDTGLTVTLHLPSTTIELVGRFTLRDRH